MQKFKGKTALITGAGTGIGKAVAEYLGKNGANVVINYFADNQQASTQESIAEIEKNGGKALWCKETR